MRAPNYSDHVDRALRYAALALTAGPPTSTDLAAIRRLHDDVATTLTEATQVISQSALGDSWSDRARAGIPAGDAMLGELQSYPRLSTRAHAQAPPSRRWSGRPTAPAASASALEVWKGLATEVFLARSCLEQLGLTPAVKASVLTDLARIAEALAMATDDLAADHDSRTASRTGGVASAARWTSVAAAACALDAAAARVQQEAAAGAAGSEAVAPTAPATRIRRTVVLVRTAEDVPNAVNNLAMLTRTGRPQVSEIFSTAIVLGVLADASAERMQASPSHSDNPRASDSAHALRAYRGELAALLRKHQRRFASLDAGNPAAIAQARELRASGVDKLQRQAAAEPAPFTEAQLERTEMALTLATVALREAVVQLQAHNAVLVFDRDRPVTRQWREAAGRDVAPLVAGLDRAIRAVAHRAPAGTDVSEHARPLATKTDSSVVDLASALERRRTALNGTSAELRSADLPRRPEGPVTGREWAREGYHGPRRR